MKIVLAPDSFKECLSSVQVCLAMERGVKRVLPDAEVEKIPLADGGEGSVDTFISATGGRIIKTLVQDPLGRLITGFFGISGDGSTAVIEMAAASGLQLLAENERNPLKTSTFGTGQLISAALDEGVSKIVLCIGGSATIDGGLGMAKALGVRFLNANGFELGEGGQELSSLARIDMTGLDPRVPRTEFVVACDVANVLCGPEGAAVVYGPQKGASAAVVEQLDQGLANFGKVIGTELMKSVADVPGAGAAGGLGAGLMAFLNAKLTSGIELMLEATALRERIQGAMLVITGEGRIDRQTAMGKAISGVGKMAQEAGVPVIALTGSLDGQYQTVYETGVTAAVPIVNGPMSQDTAIMEATELIIDATERTLRIFLAGRNSR